KPLAENYAKAREMTEAAEKAGVINMVNLTYRNVAPLQRACEMVLAGELGTIRHVEASYLQRLSIVLRQRLFAEDVLARSNQ
ncbi:hypothetical protein ACC806_38305, partial [Rhizobium ruizarguesonis]